MSYYRRLPLDVRVALWVGEHPRFMKGAGIAAVIGCAVWMLCMIGYAVAQTAPAPSTVNTLQSGAMSSGTVSMGSIPISMPVRCPAGRVPVAVAVDRSKPCLSQVCSLVDYKCAADLTDPE